ncbi:MAG TPA: pitrilysin family protein [Mycobacteriales bacterium]|nr:pitrilysin family protein [Mycobacteriales bacterium]
MLTAPDYPFTLHRLDNGLRVIVSEDHLAPVVAINIWYDVGSRHETPGRTGFAHLFEHLMFQGSANVARGEHFALINGAGGTLNGTTWCDRTNYYDTLPSHHLATGLWLEADRMGGLLAALDQDNLDNQREVVKNEKRQSYDNQPYGSWLGHLHEMCFPPGHPYHHTTIGSMADLDAASLEDARDFYRTWYAPDNAVLTVVGDVETAEVIDLANQYFGGIPAKAAFPAPPPTTIDARIGREVRRTVPDRVPVPRVFVGYRIGVFGSPAFDAARVTAMVLGGGRGSRLYKALVLDRQLLQPGDDTIVDCWPFIGGAALAIADLPARDGIDAAELEAAYHEQVAGLAAGITEAEMERAQALLASQWMHQLSKVDGRADAFGQYATLLGDPGRLNDALPALQRVTADEVAQVAAETLRPDNRAVITFLPDTTMDGEAAA